MFRSNEEPRRGLEPLRIDLIEDRFEYLSGKTLREGREDCPTLPSYPDEGGRQPNAHWLGYGTGDVGRQQLAAHQADDRSNRQHQKRRDVPVLPASLETFVQAIELLAEQRPCEVGLIGVGRGDTSFGAHTLASFPTHDPRKGKRIAWAWIKKEKRPRRVAIAEIRSENKIAYALEIERTNQEHAILVLARKDFQKIGADELQAIPADVRYEAWLGVGRSTAGISTQDHNPPGLGDAFPCWNHESGGRLRKC